MELMVRHHLNHRPVRGGAGLRLRDAACFVRAAWPGRGLGAGGVAGWGRELPDALRAPLDPQRPRHPACRRESGCMAKPEVHN